MKLQEMEVIATAYCLDSRGVDRITALGTKARRGVIAVDPKVIPFRTKIYVPNYGWGVAEDRGDAIKGKRIDLFTSSYKRSNKVGQKKDEDLFKEVMLNEMGRPA